MKVGIALGSNLGDRLANLRAARKAVVDLSANRASVIVSPVYETEPVGCEPGADKFLNAVLEIECDADPTDLLQKLIRIEESLGRDPNHARNVSRKIDVDLLYAGELPPKQVALTFDDGFKDIEENALPVLTELGFSATVFVATEVIDGTARYLWAPEDARLLDWDDITRLDRGGVLHFEPHTLTHPNLTTLGDRECRHEIEGSKAALEQQLGRATTAFCYPGGFVGGRERDLTQESGFRYGITCEPGLNKHSLDSGATDPLLVRRVQIDRTDSLGDFAAKARGSHDRGLVGRGYYRRLRYGSAV